MVDILVFCREMVEFSGMGQAADTGMIATTHLEEAKKILYSQKIKAVIVDLEGMEGEGLSLVSYLRGIHKYYLLPVIFLAADATYESQAFHVFHCFDYVTKPICTEKLMEMLNLLRGRLDPCRVPKGLILRVRGGIHRMEIMDILYIEILNRMLVVHTRYDIQTFPYRQLGECIDQCQGDLIQCHRSIAVNCEYVEKLDYANRLVYLKKEFGTVAMGRKYMDGLRQRFDGGHKIQYTDDDRKEHHEEDTNERYFSDTAWQTMQ